MKIHITTNDIYIIPQDGVHVTFNVNPATKIA